MKFNARTITVIGVLIFIVAIALLYLNYQKQSSLSKAEQKNLDTANAALAQNLITKSADENQLAQVKEQITQLQNQVVIAQRAALKKMTSLPKSLDSIEYSALFTDTAKLFNVELSGIANDGIQNVTMDKVTFSTIAFNISLQGDMNDILNLLQAMVSETGFRNATIQTININRSETVIDVPAADGKTVTTTTIVTLMVDLRVTFYGYNGN